jgi:uncharacterized protein (UPF0371 family)
MLLEAAPNPKLRCGLERLLSASGKCGRQLCINRVGCEDEFRSLHLRYRLMAILIASAVRSARAAMVKVGLAELRRLEGCEEAK